MNVKLIKELFFEAAHSNPQGNEKQRRLHGHSYRCELIVEGEVQSEYGWLIDYGDIKKQFQDLYDALDHSHLNEVKDLEDPRLPGVRAWLEERLRPRLPMLQEVRLSIVGDCVFRPVAMRPDPDRGLPERWRFTFEAAQSLPQLPKDHHCHDLHGHSYRLEIGSEDNERLKPALEELYETLDHRNLNEVEGLAGTTCEQMCDWTWRRLVDAGHSPTVVVVQETQTARSIYYGE